ncbi:hypothetical protein HDV01_001931 [Terramyces sp. JEL0728]|nr:hypothetical protein HDV01_001931 [Terramyces sp. JEL0728]
MTKYTKLEDGEDKGKVKKSSRVSKKITLIAVAAIAFVMVTFLCSMILLNDKTVKQNHLDISHSNATIERVSFMKHMQQYPFDDALTAIRKGDDQEISNYRSLILDYLHEYNSKTPLEKPNRACTKPTFEPVCNEAIFSRKRDSPAKVGMVIQFGFEVDSLLIILNQYKGLVDKLFILESTRTHFKNTKKPLVWERIKYKPEFLPFSDMVVHLVVDDSPIAVGEVDIWQMERFQERERWKKFLEWNGATKYFSDTDVLGFGDLDEVPSAQVLTELKNCQFKKDIDVVDVGIWFPMGTIHQAFRTDFPVQFNLPYTLGDPTFYTFAGAKRAGSPSRQRGGSLHHIVGGMHMSNYCYLPTMLLKDFTCSECSSFDEKNMLLMKERIFSNNHQVIKDWHMERCDVSSWGARIVNVDQLNDENKKAVSIPWYLECNKHMFPSWQHFTDSRLG